MGIIAEIKQSERNKRKVWLFLFLILVLGATLRYWHIDFGLDLKNYKTSITWAKIDEETTLNCVFANLFYGDLNPHDFLYPSFFRYFVFFIYCLFFIPKAIITKTAVLTLLQNQLVENPSIFFLIARYLSATAGVASIYFIYLLSKKVSNRNVALVASLLLALSPLHIRESHFATIDVTVTLMTIITLLFIVEIYRKGQLRYYLFSGFFIGLSVSTKYNAIVLIPALLAAGFFRKKLQLSSLVYSFLLMPLGFLAGTPYSLISPQEFLNGLALQANLLYPLGFAASFGRLFKREIANYLKYFINHRTTIPLAIGLALGLFLTFRKRHRGLSILFIYYLSYFLLLFITNVFYSRYIVLILPVWYIFSAGFIYVLAENLAQKKTSLIFFLCSLIIVSPAVFKVDRWHKSLQKQDSRKSFLEWRAEQKFSPGRVLYLTSLQLAARAIEDESREVSLWGSFDQKTKDLFPFYRREFLKRMLLKTKQILADPQSDFKYFVLSSEIAFDADFSRDLLETLSRHCRLIYEVNSSGFRRQDRELYLFIPYKDNSQNQNPGPCIMVFEKNTDKI